MGPFMVRLGQGGRTTVPAVLRRVLALAPGDPVTLIPGASASLPPPRCDLAEVGDRPLPDGGVPMVQ
jgi:bifunctional DNA-binding transcriptional regulator/antitoxin component of YhaV-PrlF toxin-antitoxin module